MSNYPIYITHFIEKISKLYYSYLNIFMSTLYYSYFIEIKSTLYYSYFILNLVNNITHILY